MLNDTWELQARFLTGARDEMVRVMDTSNKYMYALPALAGLLLHAHMHSSDVVSRTCWLRLQAALHLTTAADWR